MLPLQLMETGVVGLTGVPTMDTKPEAEVVTTLVQVVEEDNVMVTALKPEPIMVSREFITGLEKTASL